MRVETLSGSGYMLKPHRCGGQRAAAPRSLVLTARRFWGSNGSLVFMFKIDRQERQRSSQSALSSPGN